MGMISFSSVRREERSNPKIPAVGIPAVGNRGYTDKTRLRGLKSRSVAGRKPSHIYLKFDVSSSAEADIVCVDAVSNRREVKWLI